MSWLEISLNVNGELAEAVADVLARFAPNGVVVENGVYFKDADDPGTSLDEVNVRAYLPVDEKLAETRQRLEKALWYLGSIQPLPEAVFTSIAEQNWMEAWKEHYKPIPVGEKLIIVPAWLESPDPSRIPIRIDPGMAFGTGTHPTTQLCLDLLEKYLQPGVDVIDVGCGSGILSIGALKLGAGRALAVDIDQAAVDATRENAAANAIQIGLLVGLGSLDELLANQFEYQQAPLVLANILANILIRLFEGGMGRLVSRDGVLILSGILEEQAENVIQVAARHGFKLIEKQQTGDWVALVVGEN
ncbi:MAG: 50S ribosomal protein L11 methyltransferase [Chloroflexota bacterium]